MEAATYFVTAVLVEGIGPRGGSRPWGVEVWVYELVAR
jgi:hypothetical protein